MYRNKNFMKPIKSNSFRILKTTLKVSLIASGLAMSGCASYEKSQYTVGSIPKDYRTAHPIVVSQAEQHEDIIVSPSNRNMSHRHRGIVTSFVGQYKRSGARQLQIYIPSGSHNANAARHVSADMVKYMKSIGMDPNQISIEHYDARQHGEAATIRLVYGSLKAKVHGECGQWNDDLGNTSENVNYGNYGCATQNNLAEMIANPEDLLGPRGESAIDAERRDNVINTWRAAGSGQ